MWYKIDIIKITILFITMTCYNMQSQLNTDFYFCRVVDQGSDMPVVYATVKLVGTNLGVIADDKGQFKLPFDLEVSEKISLSSIGYKTKEVFINQLKKGQINTIYIEPGIEKLETVTLVSNKNKSVKKFTAREIVNNAIDNISNNYPQNHFSYIAYYRDYQQPRDNSYKLIFNEDADIEYINLNEAIVEVFDAGFGTNYLTNEENQTLLYKYKQNTSFLRDSTLAIPYDNKTKKYLKNVIITPFGGNELNLLNITNAIRNHDQLAFSYVDKFDSDFVKNHLFKLVGVRNLNDVPIYEIEISTKVGATGGKHYAKGKIYISKENFAIFKMSYQSYEKEVKEPLYAVTVEYIPIGEKMYLNYITFNNKFEANSDHYFKVTDVVFNIENTSFDIFFNRELDQNSITSRNNNLKITYKEEKLAIKNILILEDHLRVIVDKKKLFSLPDFSLEKLPQYITIKVKTIKDLKGNTLHKVPKVSVNQYRELFVQEVFPEKKKNDNTASMNKFKPLSTSRINTFEGENVYWENTPLKKSKKN
ncbi:hypothetical protein D1816_24320 [Aquimarina sp. AD10]|nr:hypothetical protein D1816_24320 [Aquimarina sp. AD10]RKN00653.1 hypothetical protein D7033_07375 [Aquimarina sp. AD10]